MRGLHTSDSWLIWSVATSGSLIGSQRSNTFFHFPIPIQEECGKLQAHFFILNSDAGFSSKSSSNKAPFNWRHVAYTGTIVELSRTRLLRSIPRIFYGKLAQLSDMRHFLLIIMAKARRTHPTSILQICRKRRTSLIAKDYNGSL